LDQIYDLLPLDSPTIPSLHSSTSYIVMWKTKGRICLVNTTLEWYDRSGGDETQSIFMPLTATIISTRWRW